MTRQSGDTNWLTWLASAINKIDDAREKHKRKMEHYQLNKTAQRGPLADD